MQRLEVSGAVRLIYRSLGVKGLIYLKTYNLENNRRFPQTDFDPR